MWRRGVIEDDRRPAPRTRDWISTGSQRCYRRIELERQSMNHRHVEPEDALSVIHLGSAVVVMRELMMRFDMAVDDGVRVRNVGPVSMQRCQPRPEDQEGDRERQHGAPGNPPKHSRIMSASFAPRQCRTRLGREKEIDPSVRNRRDAYKRQAYCSLISSWFESSRQRSTIDRMLWL